MSFDMPPDDDQHGECRHEIRHLEAEIIRLRETLAMTSDARDAADSRAKASVQAEMAGLRKRLAMIRTKLESVVCTEDPDRGVVLLSQDGPTHTEIVAGKPLQVYNHEHFSPLGDALIELWKLTDLAERTEPT